jgi:hypothetical protein
MHWVNRFVPLTSNTRFSASTFSDVAMEATIEPQLVWGINKY